MSGVEYWAEVPLEMRARMHYFNVPCDIDAASPFNPLNIVKAMYQPGDFVVVKLDIDNGPIEQVWHFRGSPPSKPLPYEARAQHL